MRTQHFYSLTVKGSSLSGSFVACPLSASLRSRKAMHLWWPTSMVGQSSQAVTPPRIAAGRAYAEEAIAYARTIGPPVFIAFVLSSIIDKAVISEKSAPLIEYGFYQRLAQTAFCGA
jgi:hypothetical protein